MQQDRWIEENFINNGGFIENTDLRLKIGNVYSLIDLCKNKLSALKEKSDKTYEKYLDYYDGSNLIKSVEKYFADKDFIAYNSLLSGTNGDLKYYIANIKELTAQIIKMSNADEKALNEMRESSKKILETLTKERE